MATGGAFVGADVELVVNCGVGVGAGKEKRHGMIKLTSTTQHTWPELFQGLMYRQWPLKIPPFLGKLSVVIIYSLNRNHPTLNDTCH